MGLLWTILIGFVIGTIAKLLVPGKQSAGFIVTTLLGIAGSWVGSWLAGMIGLGSPVGFLGSVVGAVLILVAYNWWNGRSR